MFNPLSFFVTKPSKPQPKPVSNTNWNATEKTDTQRNRAYFKEVASNGKTLTWNVSDIPQLEIFN